MVRGETHRATSDTLATFHDQLTGLRENGSAAGAKEAYVADLDVLDVVEICAGAGGQALGLERAGFEHALAVELDAAACATLRANRPGWKVAEGDVADQALWRPRDYRGVALLAGGVPCPPFTVAGRQLGATDERDLFAWAVELCGIIRPRALLVVDDRLPQRRRRCDNAEMTGLSLALANLKPGTGKTTSAVWLAHVFAQAGNSVLLVDADPSGSALEWSDLAAMDPHLAAPEAAFPFRIVALPSRELHRRVPEIAKADDVVIIDTPQIEDHAGIARSALRYADEVLIPCAPSPIEINRTTPVRDEIAEVGALRDKPARSAVLLNRCIARAHSTVDAREALENLGYDVLDTVVPRREVYAQSFGMPIRQTGCDIWRQVARDLIDRCAPLCSVRS